MEKRMALQESDFSKCKGRRKVLRKRCDGWRSACRRTSGDNGRVIAFARGFLAIVRHRTVHARHPHQPCHLGRYIARLGSGEIQTNGHEGRKAKRQQPLGRRMGHGELDNRGCPGCKLWPLLDSPSLWREIPRNCLAAVLTVISDEAKSFVASYPTRILVSEIYSYFGTARFSGAGPFRMRPAVS